MRTKDKVRKIISICLSVVIISIMIFINIKVSYAKSGIELNKGDYIKFGSYYGEKILWRVLKDDDVNKRVMLISDRILSIKPFDASGDEGNSKWEESNIRDWLNSASIPSLDNDEWTHQKPTNLTYNNYVNEAGFLSNFLQEERNIIVKMNDSGEENENGNKVTLLTKDELSLLTKAGYDSYAAKPTKKAVDESGYKRDELKEDKDWKYWTRTPYLLSISGEDFVHLVDVGGGLSLVGSPYDKRYGLRLVLWFDTNGLQLSNKSGSVEDEAYSIICYDKFNPVVIFSPSSSELTNNDVTVTFDPDDEESGVDYYKYSISIDNGNNYGNETTINGDVNQDIVLSNSGNIKIKVVVYDKAGNNSTLYSGIYKIDKVKPLNPNITYSPEGMTSGNVTVTIEYSDDSNVKQYKIDEGDWNTYNNIFTVSENCKITARGQDEAGNYSDEVICNISNIDKIGPNDATFELSTIEVTNENVIVTVHYAEDAITKEYKIGDSGSFLSYTDPIEVSENCTIYVRGYDSAGNESNITSVSITNIDKDGPNKPVVSKESGIYKEEIEVEIVKGDDDTSKIHYTLDGVIPTKDSNLYINKIKIDGVHNEEVILKVVSYDNLSNKSSIVEKHYIFNKELSYLTNKDKKNFKYYVGLNKRGLIKVMLVSKTGKDLKFDKSDILDRKGYFKEGVIYINQKGEFVKYK